MSNANVCALIKRFSKNNTTGHRTGNHDKGDEKACDVFHFPEKDITK
jgi:hypothetical protein